MRGGHLPENRKQKKMISGLKGGGGRLRNSSSGCLQGVVAMREDCSKKNIKRV